MFMLFLIKNARFGACFWPRYIATEAPLDSNGATFGLQNLSRCTSKRPKTNSKSATFESQQTLNRTKTAFSPVFRDGKIWRKNAPFFSNGGTFGILNYDFWVWSWDFWGRKTVGNEQRDLYLTLVSTKESIFNCKEYLLFKLWNGGRL